MKNCLTSASLKKNTIGWIFLNKFSLCISEKIRKKKILDKIGKLVHQKVKLNYICNFYPIVRYSEDLFHKLLCFNFFLSKYQPRPSNIPLVKKYHS